MKTEAPSYRAFPGLYYETPWLPPHDRPMGRTFRPCRDGLADFFDVPSGRRFKVCFARCDGEPAPWATRRYRTWGYIREYGAGELRVLTVENTFYLRELRAAGFEDKDPLQWWVEYEELT